MWPLKCHNYSPIGQAAFLSQLFKHIICVTCGQECFAQIFTGKVQLADINKMCFWLTLAEVYYECRVCLNSQAS